MFSSEQHLAAPLPLADDPIAEAVGASEIRAGPVPAGHDPLPPGRPLTLVSLLCGQGARPAPEQIVRYVSKDDTPLFRLESAAIEPAGSCTRIVDVVETRGLVEGDYDYHLRWPVNGGEDRTATVRFGISTGTVAAPPEGSAP